jgi:rhamnosyl/mannosyltransferase
VALFKLARAVVFPSYLRSEAFGVALLEGAMYGRPLISTEVGSGTSHVNVDGETGYVVTPGSAKALRHAMDQLHFRPDVASLMGARARRRYEQLFTGALMGRRYARVYEDLLGRPREETLRLAAGADD